MPRYLLVSEPFSLPSVPPASPDRDSVTARLLQAGDPEGLVRLLTDHGSRIRSKLRKDFGGVMDESDMEEVMSLASVRAWNAARRLDARRSSLRAWFGVIARNCALTLLEVRARGGLRFEPDLDLRPQAVPCGPSADPRQMDLIRDLHRCIDRLPALQRAVVLADLQADGTAPADVLAEQLRTSTNSIYVSRWKGRTALRKALAGMGHDFASLQAATSAPGVRAGRVPEAGVDERRGAGAGGGTGAGAEDGA